MADEGNPVLALLQEVNAKVGCLATEQQEMRIEQREMRTEMSTKFERVTTRLDRLKVKADRAAVRADDVMGSQIRMATDIAALRAAHEDDERQLANEFGEDISEIRERLDALEQQRTGQ